MTTDKEFWETIGTACLVFPAVYTAIPLIRSYWKDWTAEWPSKLGVRKTLLEDADTLRKLNSLLPWPVGLIALIGVAIKATTTAINIYDLF
jgi:hypothetical protein